MKKQKICSVLNILMIFGIVLFLLAGLARAVLRPKDINSYENRPAAKLPAFTLTSWMNGHFQDGVEAALGDQAPLAYTMKKQFNSVDNAVKIAALSLKTHNDPTQMVMYEGYRIYGGKHIAFAPRSWEDTLPRLQSRTENLSGIIQSHPEIRFDVYYIEKDTDIVFETGEKLGVYEYLCDHLPLPAKQIGRFETDSLQTFEQYFYCTDHHWNHLGSYLGYQQVTKLLDAGPAIAPSGDAVEIRRQFSGSKAALLGAQGLLTEPFWAYPFPYADMDVTVNGVPESYGKQEAFFQVQPMI